MNKVSLTVAIPTYNRAAAVQCALEDVVPLAEAGEISALVIDDGSTDDTWRRLQRYTKSGVRILRNEENIGYTLTFCRILREVNTEWVLLSEDDGRLIPERIAELQDWVQKERPDFVSTQWYKADGRLFRGRESIGPVRPSDLRCASNHAPGLVFRVAPALSALPLLEEHLRQGSVAARIYPQVFVAAHLIAGYRAMWWSGTVGREGFALPSGITDEAGRPYWDPASRVSQVLAFDLLFREMAAMAPSAHYRRVSRQLRMLNGRGIYPTVRGALLAENPRSDARFFDANMGASSRRNRRAEIAKGIPGLVRLVRLMRSIRSSEWHKHLKPMSKT